MQIISKNSLKLKYLPYHRMPLNEYRQVGYGEFVRYLDWIDHPIASVPGVGAEGSRPESKQRDVDFSAMIQDIFGGN